MAAARQNGPGTSRQALGLLLVAVLILAILVVRYGRVISWFAK